MQKVTLLMGSILFFVGANAQKIFDVHIHGDKDPSKQLAELVSNGVYKAAISTSWDLQTNYKTTADLIVLQGLLLACPEGKVPYSLQYCFPDQKNFLISTGLNRVLKKTKFNLLERY